MKRIFATVVVCLLGVALAHAQSQVQPNGQAAVNHASLLQKMPDSLEVRFALSALPANLRDKATVYVLDPSKGYRLYRAGSNGQTCFVGRTEWKFADYRDDIFDPVCYDAEGAKNHMRVWFDAAALRAKGVSPDAMKKEIEARYKNGTYKAPDRPGFSYMTAPLMRTYMSLDPNDKNTVMTMTLPHVMHYAPNVSANEVGGISCPPCAPYPFLFEPGPHGYVIQRLGDKESEKIVADESELVQELCSYRSDLCLQPKDSQHSAH